MTYPVLFVLALMAASPNFAFGYGKELQYQTPKAWQAVTPESSMRKAQYMLPGAKAGDEGELAVFHFPREGGTTQANLQRWYGQFEKADGKPVTKPDQERAMEINGLKVVRVALQGTYIKAKSPMMMAGPTERIPNQTLLGGIVETPQGSWFFKAVGPTATLEKWKADFDKMLESVKL